MKKIIITLLISIILFVAFIFYPREVTPPVDLKPIVVNKQQLLIEKQNDETKQLLEKCVNGTIDNPVVIVNPYRISPLSALIQFTTQQEEEVTITVVGKTEATSLITKHPKTTNHLIPIIGLYSDQETTVKINCGKTTKTLTIQADKIPDDAAIPQALTNKTKEKNVLYFTTPASKGYVSGYDTNGDLRFIITEKMVWDVNQLSDGMITMGTNRIISSPYYTTGFVTMDFLGHIDKEVSLPGGYHHDIDELPNGNYLVASDDFHKTTVEDVVVEVDKNTGEIVKSFDLSKIMQLDDNASDTMEDGKNLDWTKKDWFHNNSVDYQPDNNTLTVSGRHQDCVAVIDYDTKKLLYIIGSPKGWSEKMQPYFLKPIGENFEWQWMQHAATWIDKDHIMIFDNGVNRSKTKEGAIDANDNYSRAVVYKVDVDKKEITQVYQYGKERGSSYYSPYICDVDYLGKNHYLVTSGGISFTDNKVNNIPGSLAQPDEYNAYVTEVKNNDVILEFKWLANIYRSEKMSMNTIKMATLEPKKQLGSLKETHYTPYNETTKVEPLESALSSTLSITSTSDSFEFSVELEKHDNFAILLRNNKEQRLYTLQTDEAPGMCVAVFNQKDSNKKIIKKLISFDGLSDDMEIIVIKNNFLYTGEQTIKDIR